MSAFETTTIAALERPGGWSSIRRELGIRAFGINAWTAEPGGRLIPEHDEVPSGHEELYLVTAGCAVFTVAGEEIEAPAGTIVFVRDPTAKRGAVAAEGRTTVVAVGGRPGKAYRPRSWETNAEALPLWDAADFAGIKRVMTDALDRYEDRGIVLYNLACAEAQLGETEAALEHLAAAIADQPGLAEHVAEDHDLDPIREDPRFPE